uniref:BAR domain-containing protein n=1 Tax=Eptatretus burgeri TaxID=7764 RepID=A0A8C4N1C7_EPTBU
MGLPALEFRDCHADGPRFRETLRQHELELDHTSRFVKDLIKQGKAIINASKGTRSPGHTLRAVILKMLGAAPCCRFVSFVMENAPNILITPLESFRKRLEVDLRKKFEKESERYYSLLDKHATISTKKKETQIREVDRALEIAKDSFYQTSLEYVETVQEAQERKMFELTEPVRLLLGFIHGMCTFKFYICRSFWNFAILFFCLECSNYCYFVTLLNKYLFGEVLLSNTERVPA